MILKFNNLKKVFLIGGITFSIGFAEAQNFQYVNGFSEAYSGAGDAADFDLDGDIDIVYSDENGGIKIGLNDGQGNFTRSLVMSNANAYRTPILARDVNKDGKPDIIGVQGLYVLLNRGNNIFTSIKQSIKQGTGAGGDVEIVDLNKDGFNDIIWVNSDLSNYQSTSKNEIWLGTTDTTFSYSASFDNYAVGPRNSLSLGDIDKDGDLDIVTGGASWSGQVLKNNNGVFIVSQGLQGYRGGATFVDWNRDGYLDVITGDDYNGYGLRVSLNDKTGTFGAATLLAPKGDNAVMLDLNGDTYLDAVMPVFGGNTRVFINDGCNLVENTSYGLSKSSHGIIVADFNKDTKPDIMGFGRDVANDLYYNFLTTVSGTTCKLTDLSEEIKSINFNICPNPAKDEVKVKLGAYTEGTLSIINLNGLVIKNVKLNTNETSVSISELNAGLYFLKIDTDKELFITKLIKE